jgi:hypothetical protein
MLMEGRIFFTTVNCYLVTIYLYKFELIYNYDHSRKGGFQITLIVLDLLRNKVNRFV